MTQQSLQDASLPSGSIATTASLVSSSSRVSELEREIEVISAKLEKVQ